ncbi:MAG: hypothetical protein AAGA03_20170, partial [Planctomycetota bacterium]
MKSDPDEPISESAREWIEIACRGRIEYDFAMDRLVLSDDVSLTHHTPLPEHDQFDCQRLTVDLREPNNRDLPRESPTDWLRNITAEGLPAIARLRTRDSEIAANTIQLDAQGGWLRATGPRGIGLRVGLFGATLRQLEYQFDTANPKAAGRLIADGPGRMISQDPQQSIKEVRWNSHLELRPAPTDAADQHGTKRQPMELLVDGGIDATFTDQGSATAESIRGLVIADSRNKPMQFIPQRFTAAGAVAIDTSKLAVQTKRLAVDFVETAQPKAINSDEDTSGVMRTWVAQPVSTRTTTVKPIARSRPTVRGDTIAVQMARGGDWEVQDLSVNGNVQLNHQLEARGKTLLANLEGQKLRLGTVDGQDILYLGSGPEAPARLKLADGYFVGPEIQIWLDLNIVQINQAGEFQLPTEMLPRAISLGAVAEQDSQAASNVVWKTPPRCRFEGGMSFDGRRVLLNGGVLIDAEFTHQQQPWTISMRGESLIALLDSSVQLRDMQSLRQAVIQSITLVESQAYPVVVEAEQRSSDGVKEAKHVLQMPQ